MLKLDIEGFSESEVMALLLTGLEQRKGALEIIITRIESQIAGNKVATKTAKAAKTANPASARRPMSPEARARIVAAQQKRWAKVRKAAKAAEKAAAAPKAPKAKAVKAAPVKRTRKPAGTVSPAPAPEVTAAVMEA